MWRQGYSAFFAYEGAAAAFGQEQSLVAAESGRSTPRLTGAGARSAEGTNTGHENAEGMASVGVRVEPPVSHHASLLADG